MTPPNTEQKPESPNEQYRRLLKEGKKKSVPEKEVQPSTPEERIKEALKAMGHYFELPEKEVRFYVRQLELSGKL